MKKTVVIGISSGIAAYKIVDLINLLVNDGVNVEVIMTTHANRMLDPAIVEKATGQPIHTQLYSDNFDFQDILKTRTVDHIALADKADVFVIAPATANIISKLAHGIADDFLTTTALAITAPTIICPSMNVNMWNNPFIQKNTALLKKSGMMILEPEEGPLACGYEGKGRLADIRHIYDEIKVQLERSASMKGKQVVVTAGATIDPVDAVRILSNRGTGRMGVAIAEECYLRGADVTLIRAKASVAPRYPMQQLLFETPEELEDLLFSHTPQSNFVFHTAAVGDFRVKTAKKKLSSKTGHTLELTPRTKIISQLKKWNPKAFITGFKAEYQPDIQKLASIAKKKLLETQADMIVANDISKSDRGFAADTNEVILVDGKSSQVIPLSSKKNIAKEIVNRVIKKASVA